MNQALQGSRHNREAKHESVSIEPVSDADPLLETSLCLPCTANSADLVGHFHRAFGHRDSNQDLDPFLMLEGRAREDIEFYVSLVPGSRILSLQLYGPERPGVEGTVLLAEVVLRDLHLKCSDSAIEHKFTFTPSMSQSVTCGFLAKIDDNYR